MHVEYVACHIFDVEAARCRARECALPVRVAVVDGWGAVVASGRMDVVPSAGLEFATDKTYMAALGKSSKALFERMASSDELTLGLQTRSRLCAWEGGLPMHEGDRLVGAIGVTSGQSGRQCLCKRCADEPRLGLSFHAKSPRGVGSGRFELPLIP
ncbi:MAG: heme-binding protein [Boseongicola sp.]|nr:heme-binding protein [Boseongicola sp.]